MSLSDRILGAIQKHLGYFVSSSNHVKVRCPFHSGGKERTPSLAIVPERGVWFCHGCDRGGSLNTLLKKVSGKDYNFPVVRVRRQEETGLDSEILNLFDPLPDSELVGYARSEIRRCEVLYDPHRKRVVYPIRDISWRLVGVVGRLTRDEIERKQERVGKYKKYAQAEWDLDYVFHKSDHLWPLHLEYFQQLRDQTPVVLVEGFKAALWLRSVGLRAYALMTSHMSKEQRRLLERITDEVYLWLDWDAAGLRGMLNIAEVLCQSLSVRIVEPPDFEREKQPDDCPLEAVPDIVAQAPRFILGR